MSKLKQNKAKQDVCTILSIHMAITQPLSRVFVEKRNNLLDLCLANVVSCCHCQKQHLVMHYCNLPRGNKCFFISRAVKDLNKNSTDSVSIYYKALSLTHKAQLPCQSFPLRLWTKMSGKWIVLFAAQEAL